MTSSCFWLSLKSYFYSVAENSIVRLRLRYTFMMELFEKFEVLACTN